MKYLNIQTYEQINFWILANIREHSNIEHLNIRIFANNRTFELSNNRILANIRTSNISMLKKRTSSNILVAPGVDIHYK